MSRLWREAWWMFLWIIVAYTFAAVVAGFIVHLANEAG